MNRNPLTLFPMALTQKSGMVEILPDIFVTKEALKAHSERMAQEAEASERSDVMSCAEEDEWKVAEQIRKKYKGTLAK